MAHTHLEIVILRKHEKNTNVPHVRFLSCVYQSLIGNKASAHNGKQHYESRQESLIMCQSRKADENLRMGCEKDA